MVDKTKEEMLAQMNSSSAARGRKQSTLIDLTGDVPLAGETLLAEQNLLAQQNMQIITQHGDGLPYDRDRLVNEARFYLANAAEAMLEAGKRLIMLKEVEGHGTFVALCEERLGITERSAQKMMQAALKYLSPELEKHTAKLQQLGKSKLLELLAEDDEDLAALAEGGTVAGLELDDVERMSCRELRKALRETREDKNAQGRVMADKDTKLNELSAQLARKPLVEVKPLDEQLQELRLEATAKAGAAEAAISGALYPAIHLLMQHEGADQRVFAAGLLAQVEQALVEIRAEYGIAEAPTVTTGPAWMAEDSDAQVAAAIAAAQSGQGA